MTGSAARGAGLRVVAWPAGGGNPYTRALYRELAGLGVEVVDFTPLRICRARGAIWHIHWPERMLNQRRFLPAVARAAALVGLAVVAHARGSKVVWTVHNLTPHERYHPGLERWFWRAFLDVLDGYIALSASSRRRAVERHPRLACVPGFVVPHGHYRGEYGDPMTRAEARRALGLGGDGVVVAFVGQVRPYKGVPHLIRTFREAAGASDVLLIAGDPNPPNLAEEVRSAAAGDRRVRFRLGFVPDAELRLILGAADLVVLPFREMLNSGSVLLALSFDRPVLVPALEGLVELQEEVGSEWVHTYMGELTPAVLCDAMTAARTPSAKRCDGLDARDWAPLAARTLDAFRYIHCDGTGGPRA